jgi:hypothetical protein
MMISGGEEREEYGRLIKWLDDEESHDTRKLVFCPPPAPKKGRSRKTMADLPAPRGNQPRIEQELRSVYQHYQLSEWLNSLSPQPLPTLTPHNDSHIDIASLCAVDNTARLLDEMKRCLDDDSRASLPFPLMDLFKEFIDDDGDNQKYGFMYNDDGFTYSKQSQHAAEEQEQLIVDDSMRFLNDLIHQLNVRQQQLAESMASRRHRKPRKSAAGANGSVAPVNRRAIRQQQGPLISPEMVLSAASQIQNIPVVVLERARQRLNQLFSSQ